MVWPKKQENSVEVVLATHTKILHITNNGANWMRAVDRPETLRIASHKARPLFSFTVLIISNR